jgi:hypothetical protein
MLSARKPDGTRTKIDHGNGKGVTGLSTSSMISTDSLSRRGATNECTMSQSCPDCENEITNTFFRVVSAVNCFTELSEPSHIP